MVELGDVWVDGIDSKLVRLVRIMKKKHIKLQNEHYFVHIVHNMKDIKFQIVIG